MSLQTKDAPPAQPITFAAVETAYCTCCGAQIPAQHIARNIIPVRRDQVAPPTRQTVRAWCEHCDRLYEVTRELSGGVWTLISDVEVVTDRKRIDSFKARIALIRGDIQVGELRTQSSRPTTSDPRPATSAKEGK